jgi:hypothetical protein
VNVEQELEMFLSAMNAAMKLPLDKITENEGLRQEIKDIVNSKMFNSILANIYNQSTNERLAMAANSSAKHTPESPEFIKAYARYQSAACGVLSDGAAKNQRVRYTDALDTKSIRAFNAEIAKKNPFKDKKITSLKETKAFNSMYSDWALQIGTSQDPTRIGSYIDYSPYIYNYQYYLSIPTLSQTIDLSVNMATRQPPKIKFEDPKLSEKIELHFKRSQFTQKIQKMLLYSMLSPRGSLIVPIEDGARLRFNIFNDTQFTYATSYQYSRIDFRDNQTGVSELFVLGHLLQNEVTAHFLCPGFEPIYAIGKNKLFQLKDAAEAVNIYLYTIKVLCIRAQVMVQKMSGSGQNDSKIAALQRVTADLDSKLSLNTTVRLPDDSELTILNNNLSEGFAKVSPIIQEYQGMLTGIDGSFFYGSDSASYAGNNFNMRATFQNVRSQIQEAQIEPIYRYVINCLLDKDERFSQHKSEIGNFDIEFESLYEPTETEKLTEDSMRIDNLIKMSDAKELEGLFKKEGLLRDEFTFSNLDEDPNNDTLKT